MGETDDTKNDQSRPRPRVSIDAEAWRQVDAILSELPFRLVAPVVSAINQTGGVNPIDSSE